MKDDRPKAVKAACRAQGGAVGGSVGGKEEEEEEEEECMTLAICDYCQYRVLPSFIAKPWAACPVHVCGV